MLTSWMTTATVGMMFARYMKSTAKGQKLLGKDVWFVVSLSQKVHHGRYGDVR